MCYSQFQAQALFGAYLQKVLHRLKTTEIKYEKVTIADKEMQCDVVLQFLHMISQNLTMPLQFKVSMKCTRETFINIFLWQDIKENFNICVRYTLEKRTTCILEFSIFFEFSRCKDLITVLANFNFKS